MGTPMELDYEDLKPTAKTCADCKGEGFIVVERGTIYRGEPCIACRGTGCQPMGSGMHKKCDG